MAIILVASLLSCAYILLFLGGVLLAFWMCSINHIEQEGHGVTHDGQIPRDSVDSPHRIDAYTIHSTTMKRELIDRDNDKE